MEIKLTRIARHKDYTIGRMEIDNEYICDTLEPTWRDLAHGGRKQKGKTAIPEGRYALVVTKSPKFKKWLPLLLGVPGSMVCAYTRAIRQKTRKGAYSWDRTGRKAWCSTRA